MPLFDDFSDESNPFLDLGIQPHIIASLDDVRLADLVNSLYRKLSLLYHPDRNPGDSDALAMFKRIAAAREMLDPENKSDDWVMYKKDALKKIPAEYKIEQLEARLGRANDKFLAVRKNFFDYLMAIAGCSDVVTVANVGYRELYVHDQILLINGQSDDDDRFRYQVRKPNNYYFRWIIKDDGSIFYDKGSSGPKLQKGKRLVGSVSKDTVYKASRVGDIAELLNVAKRIWTPDDELDRKSTIVERYLPNFREPCAPVELYDGRLSVEQFMKIVHFITPVIDEECFLFAINTVKGKEPFFTLEGRVESMNWDSSTAREEALRKEIAEDGADIDDGAVKLTKRKFSKIKLSRRNVGDSSGD